MSDKQKCPFGYEWCKEVDQYDECETCSLWEKCINNKEIEDNEGELKDKGYGEKLVGSDFEHYRYCEYEEQEKYVVIC